MSLRLEQSLQRQNDTRSSSDNLGLCNGRQTMISWWDYNLGRPKGEYPDWWYSDGGVLNYNPGQGWWSRINDIVLFCSHVPLDNPDGYVLVCWKKGDSLDGWILACTQGDIESVKQDFPGFIMEDKL